MHDDRHRFTKTELGITVVLMVMFCIIVYFKYRQAQVAAGEAEAIADTRAVMTAELTFASANCGFFDDLQNLCRDGDDCNGINIPGYPANAPEFLSGELARSSPYVKSSYERSFVGVPIKPSHRSAWDPTRCSPTSLGDFCYYSSPVPLGWFMLEVEYRSFAGHGAGDLHELARGEPLQCPMPHEPGFFE